MSLWDMLRRAWRKFELFAYAMDYDERIDGAVWIENLDRVQKSHGAALTAVEDRIRSLSSDVAALSEQVAAKPRSAG